MSSVTIYDCVAAADAQKPSELSVSNCYFNLEYLSLVSSYGYDFFLFNFFCKKHLKKRKQEKKEKKNIAVWLFFFCLFFCFAV